MKYFVTALLVLMLGFPVNAMAAKNDAVKPGEKAKAPVMDKAAKEKEALVNNINNLRNQEVRLIVVQQLLNEEVAKLRNVQSVFCDQYKLDVEKFRKGLYRYDESRSKFIEVAPEKQAGK